MGSDDILANVTRALLVGATIGSTSLLQGCTTSPGTAGAAASSSREVELCSRVLSRRDMRALETLIADYPQSRCLPLLISALPPSVLRSVSAEVLAGMSPAVRAAPAVRERLTAPSERGGRY